MDMMIEVMGYVAMFLLVISFVFQYSPPKMRLVNSIACFLFVVYSICKSAYPVAIANAIIIGINIFYHIRYIKKERQ
ncbi:MAG: hypothetical protein ACRCR9_02460 [Chitinophagaceae bacterium]